MIRSVRTMNSNLFVREVRIKKEIPDNNYLSRLSVVRSLHKMGGLRFRKNVTFIVGENGVGKSTFIEGLAVALGFNPEGGTVNFNFSTNDSHSPILMTFPDSEIWEITEAGINAVNYKDTEHYIVTKRFMDAPEKMIESLL